MQRATTEGRRERKKRELRARIYETARQLFLEHGFEATTVEQIAEAADIAQATFFNHFQSKNAVLVEMTSEVFDRIQALLDQQLARPGSAQARIEGFAESAATEVAQAGSLARTILLELMRTAARFGSAVPYLSRVHEPFTLIIREGQERGEVRRDLDAGFLAEMVVGAFNAAITNWMNDAEYPLEARFRQAAAFIGEAILPGPSSAPGRGRRVARNAPRSRRG
jgi:AcrR family transcriptional regulator